MAVDHYTGSLLDLLADDERHARAADEVERVILGVAFDHDGHVDPNLVRRGLPTWIRPQIIGPTYRRLCLEGVLTPDGWTVSDDHRGRNSGKPARTYRLRGDTS